MTIDRIALVPVQQHVITVIVYRPRDAPGLPEVQDPSDGLCRRIDIIDIIDVEVFIREKGWEDE